MVTASVTAGVAVGAVNYWCVFHQRVVANMLPLFVVTDGGGRRQGMHGCRSRAQFVLIPSTRRRQHAAIFVIIEGGGRRHGRHTAVVAVRYSCVFHQSAVGNMLKKNNFSSSSTVAATVTVGVAAGAVPNSCVSE